MMWDTMQYSRGNDMSKKDHWANHIKQWKYIGTPLRPCESDIAVYEHYISDIAQNRMHPLTVVLLGVTPELADLEWPRGTVLYAVERSPTVADALWIKRVNGRQLCIGDWFNMPFLDGSIDLIIGDGCFTTLPSPNLYKMVNAELSRILNPGGFFIHRFFIRPACEQSLDLVLQYAEPNFHAFKWRLAMSIQKSFLQGVAVHDIWLVFKNNRCKNDAWLPEVASTIDAYCKSQSRYTFPSLLELEEVMCSQFEQLRVTRSYYTLGDCCPVILYKKR